MGRLHDRPMPASSLSRLFDPRSIAVVGASANEEKPGFQILRALEPFRGTVHAVNPRGGTILGRPVHRSLGDVPEPVDLVALVLPAQHSLAVLKEAAAIGAGGAFMVSGGFAETGDAGAVLEAEIADACRDGGIRLLGPNTSGFLRPSRGLACTFLPAATEIPPGSIGIVAQSGGINLTLAMMANAAGLGVSLAVGLGNASDVGIAETLDYLADGPGDAGHRDSSRRGGRRKDRVRGRQRRGPGQARDRDPGRQGGPWRFREVPHRRPHGKTIASRGQRSARPARWWSRPSTTHWTRLTRSR